MKHSTAARHRAQKVVTQAVTGKASKMAGDQCFWDSDVFGKLPEAGLEPARGVNPIGF